MGGAPDRRAHRGSFVRTISCTPLFRSGWERRPVFASTARDFIEKAIQTDKAFLAGFDPDVDKAAFGQEWAARQTDARTEVHSFEPNYASSSIPTVGSGVRCSPRLRVTS